MTRIRNLLAVAGLTAGMLFAVSTTARADDWKDRDGWRARHEQREQYREYWRDADGHCFRRVWDPYRGWIVVRFYPPVYPAWERHHRGRHLGWYKHERHEWPDRDDD